MKEDLNINELVRTPRESTMNKPVSIPMTMTQGADIINKAQEKSATYLAACEARKASINSDVEKIKSYIK